MERWCALLAVVLLVAGCATQVGNHTFLDKPYPARPVAHTIDIFTNGLPSRPFERVAVLDAHCESQFWKTPTFQKDALPVLIKEARAAGCDGIIEIEMRKPDNWTFETKSLHFTATGIVYK